MCNLYGVPLCAVFGTTIDYRYHSPPFIFALKYIAQLKIGRRLKLDNE